MYLIAKIKGINGNLEIKKALHWKMEGFWYVFVVVELSSQLETLERLYF